MLAAALALGAVAVSQVTFDPPSLVGIGYVAAVTAPLWATDARERRLPNALVLPGYPFAAVGLGWQWLAHGSPPWQAMACSGATLVVFALVAATGGLGMGDVKLAGLLALVLGGLWGAPAVVLALSLATVAGALVALVTLVVLAWRRRTGAGRGDDLPLGPFLLSGFWIAADLCA